MDLLDEKIAAALKEFIEQTGAKIKSFNAINDEYTIVFQPCPPSPDESPKQVHTFLLIVFLAAKHEKTKIRQE